MKLRKFGEFEGKDIELYTLKNCNGVELDVMTYGATITSLRIPNGDGTYDDIVCGFDTFEEYFAQEYKDNSPYFGATIGRYCSVIVGAKYTKNSKVYNLSANCGEDNLHGGIKGFDKCVWKAKEIENGVEFSRVSLDNEEGFPHNAKLKVRICLSDENALSFEYFGSVDGQTPLSMTNHSYFNLSGFKSGLENCSVQINSDKKLPFGAKGKLNDNIVDLNGSVDDLREFKNILEVQEKMKDNFEHFYLFDSLSEEERKVAELVDEKSGRALEVYTTEGGMLFYTCKYTSDKLSRNGKDKYGKTRAFCFETHRHPNGVNIDDYDEAFCVPEKDFYSKTTFKLRI